ncbi:alpha-1,3-glucan synthase Ags3, partial [Micractinium conductrix]
MFNVLDMVLNHVGYGSSIFLPPFNPFSDPSNFNNCTNLNHSVPFVRTQLEEWTQWIVAQFSAHLLRLDAAGNIHPDFFPWYANTTDLVAWLEVGADVALVQQYEQVRDGAEYSYQGWSMAAAMNACFGLLPESFQPDIGCERLAALRKELWDMKVDTHNLGMWVENHDTDRFLTLRDNLPAYRNALAHVLLSESIPIIYYGAEQSMAGSLSNNTNRSPLWETGFSTAGPMYRFIRTLAWYRWWMTLGWETFDVRFTDRRTFAFSRGNKLLVVLTNGNYSEAVPRPAEYRLSGLDGFAGARLCDALHSGFCVDVSGNGIASVTPSPDDEPLVLVRQSWVKDEEFFTPLEHRPNDPGMVMHVALEYAVPHMGLTGQLQYGGLGKVVETFICHTARPMLVCAPMYAPFYGPDGRLAGDLANSGPLLSMTAVPAGPTVFFLLLDSDVFRNRTRGTIYQHASEDEELAFFSVFNQAVAHTLRVASLQLHDYHGALSLLYLPHQLPLRVLLVAHNADYNGTWHLGTAAREAHVYDMLNVPINAHTRSLCEHSGRFNMLRPVLEHMRTVQGGLGVVAVSPRYALRAHSKFSMFWDLPHACVIGILNGMEDSLGEVAAAAAAADPNAFFARKAAARLAFQEAKGLQVGEDFRLLVFMGRITHQKGCDIIGLAARTILKQNRNAQLVMVGPIGDEYGEQAKHALEKVSADFPGRVWNGAGQYIMGADKEQLCMAADFFLCPSRFEPCGLADIEFG